MVGVVGSSPIAPTNPHRFPSRIPQTRHAPNALAQPCVRAGGDAVRVRYLHTEESVDGQFPPRRCSERDSASRSRRSAHAEEVPEPAPVRHAAQQLHHAGRRQADGARGRRLRGARRQERRRPDAQHPAADHPRGRDRRRADVLARRCWRRSSASTATRCRA